MPFATVLARVSVGSVETRVIVPGAVGSVTSAGLALDESQGLSFAVSLLGRATAPSLGAPPGDIPAQALSSRGPTEADLVVVRSPSF